MARPYSNDLRERVLKRALAGESIRAIASALESIASDSVGLSRRSRRRFAACWAAFENKRHFYHHARISRRDQRGKSPAQSFGHVFTPIHQADSVGVIRSAAPALKHSGRFAS